jgi:poly(hydroxyalkanoate) depolymerase family esterase
LDKGATFEEHNFANAAGARTYKLYVPRSYDGSALPLVVMLHGCTQNPDDFAAGTQMNQVAEEAGCLVVYPEQTSGANQSKCWNWFNSIDQQRGQGEPSIIAGIAEKISDDYAVNPQQVYVAGLSAGGAMAVIVGTLYPDLFAAVGVHSGLPTGCARDVQGAFAAMSGGAPTVRRAKSGATPPTIVFHGDADTTVNPVNGERILEAAGLTSGPGAQRAASASGVAYSRRVYVDGQGAERGEQWTIHGAGHAWAGGDLSGTYTDPRGPDASAEMLRFFLRHPRR